MKYVYLSLIAFCGLLSSAVHPKALEYVEDAYLVQAPQEIINLAEKAAELVDFKKGYEIVIAKKPALHINPWNKFISLATNPQTQNHVIIINQPWFSAISEDQQLFLLARFFVMVQEGMTPLSMKLMPFLFLCITILLTILFFWLLGKTQLVHQKRWIRALIAFAMVIVVNLVVMNKVAQKLTMYVAERHDANIIALTIEKTGNKEAALKALEYFDVSIKKEIAEGETFWQPLATIFEKHVNELKK